MNPDLSKLTSNQIEEFATSWSKIWNTINQSHSSDFSSNNRIGNFSPGPKPSSGKTRKTRIVLGISIFIGIIGLVCRTLLYINHRKGYLPQASVEVRMVTPSALDGGVKHKKSVDQFKLELRDRKSLQEMYRGNVKHEIG